MQAEGNSDELTYLYNDLKQYNTLSATYMYEAIGEAIDILEENKDILKDYSPAIVVLTDGRPNGEWSFEDLKEAYDDLDMDIPIFGIMFGDAQEEDLEEIATMSKARVFDGRNDMIKAFQNVKGYN